MIYLPKMSAIKIDVYIQNMLRMLYIQEAGNESENN